MTYLHSNALDHRFNREGSCYNHNTEYSGLGVRRWEQGHLRSLSGKGKTQHRQVSAYDFSEQEVDQSLSKQSEGTALWSLELSKGCHRHNEEYVIAGVCRASGVQPA